jgi:hypothetical protein
MVGIAHPTENLGVSCISWLKQMHSWFDGFLLSQERQREKERAERPLFFP